jgi:acyl-CoA thioesterase
MAAVGATATPGGFSAELSAEWNCPIVPQGGVLAAVLARAAELELANGHDGAGDQRLRSLQVIFAEPVAAGSTEIDVTMIRRGRSMSQGQANIRSSDRQRGATAIAVFGGPRRGERFQTSQPPELPPPEECWSWRELKQPAVGGFPSFPYWDHVERRSPPTMSPFDAHPGGRLENCSWFRYDEIPRRADGSWEPLGLVALSDMMPGAVFEFLGDAAGDLYGPSADFTVHLFGEARGEWLVSRNRCRIALDGYASVDMELFDGPNLVAYATQVMYFTYPKFFENRSESRDRVRAELRDLNPEFVTRYGF